MSAPHTNIERQKRHHIAPLVGIAAVCLFALVLFLGWMFMVADRGGTPRTPERMIDGRTGQVEQAQPRILPPEAGTGAPAPQTEDVRQTPSDAPAQDAGRPPG